MPILSPRIHCLLTAAVVAAAAHAAPASALDIAQSPLFLGEGVKPNFIMAVDDSMSMFMERTFPGGDPGPDSLTWNMTNKSMFATGKPGVLSTDGPYYTYTGVLFEQVTDHVEFTPPVESFAFARSPDFNRMYFHPAVQYQPWRKADGGRWPDATPTSVRMDPRAGAMFAPENTRYFNLTAATGYSSTTQYILYPGMVLRAGTWFASNSLPYVDKLDQKQKMMSGCGKKIPATALAWQQLAQDVTISWDDMNNDGQTSGSESWCTLKLRFFPATFYLKQASSLPNGYGYVAAPLEIKNAFGPNSESLWRYEIRSANFASATAYNAAIRNFANWFQYHRNRFLATVSSTTEAWGDVDGVRLGTFPINDRTTVDMSDMAVPAERAAAYARMTNLQAAAKIQNNLSIGATPNRDAVAHIGEQFRAKGPGAPIQAACQVNVGMLFTDGYTSLGNGPKTFGNVDASAGAPFADAYADTMADIVASYYAGSKTPLRSADDFPLGQVPTPSSCKSDPDPGIDCESNLHMRFYAVTLGPQGSIYGSNVQATLDPYTHTPDWNSLGDPSVVGAGAAVDEIWHATLNGRGQFVNAQTPGGVTQAIKSAIADSLSNASTTSAASAGGSRRDAGFLAYLTRFDAEDWSGDLRAHALDENGALGAQQWSASERLKAVDPSQRKIYFSDEGKMLKPFTVSDLGGQQSTVARLGLPSSEPYGKSVEQIVAYLRGDHSQEKKQGGTLRDRSGRIGDIFGSQAEVLTAAGFGYSGLSKEQGGGSSGPGSYGEFLNDTKAKRLPVAFVGANDGMLHAFDASAGASGGKELFAVIPGTVLPNVGALPDPNYQHRYFVDGSPVQGDAFDGAWKTILLVPMGAGGASILALDVTDPSTSFGPQNFLWEFKDPDLNETLGRPHIVMLQDGTWAAVFGSGIDADPSGDNNQFLYFVNLFSGEMIAKVAATGTKDGVDRGFVNLVPIDSDYDLKADAVYAADYSGFLWRVDIDGLGTIELGNAGQPLFRAVGKQGEPQIVTGGIDAFPHHVRGNMVFFGTGRYLEAGVDTMPQSVAESFYGIWDDPEGATPIVRGDLQLQSIVSEENTQGLETRRISDIPVDWGKQRGWVLDLAIDGQPLSGEKFVGVPTVALGRVIFPTYQPLFGNACTGGGVNRLYSLSASSGVGDLLLPNGQSALGALEIPASSAGGGPVQQPAIVTSPPPAPCIPGSPGCPLPQPDMEGNVLSAPSAGCRTNLGVLMSDGLLTFDRLTCGRQSWQQLQ